MGRQVQILDPQILWSIALVLAIATAFLIGAIVLQRARKDLLGEEDAPEDVGESLREAFEAGEMSDEEYRKVRASLGESDPGPKPPKISRF